MKPHFPQPNETALLQAQALTDLIKQRIREYGPISFQEYMQLALYTPGKGYYSGGSIKIGANGDFITAPEISPEFAYCLATQCCQIISSIPQAIIMELGAGTGILAADLLLSLEKMDNLPDEYWILETSADFQQRQLLQLTARCPHLLSRIKWLHSLPQQNFNGVIIGNEVIDALSVSRFVIKNAQAKELGVDYDGRQFNWVELNKPNVRLIEQVDAIQFRHGKLPEGYCSEINLYTKEWLQAVTEHLERGVAIWIDYGYPSASYYHPSRSNGTLMCYYQHLAHSDPFVYPGLQDITAHVDFTALAQAGIDSGLELNGYCSQAAFLLNCGIMERLNETHDITQQSKIKKLIAPQHMGDSFKVMAFSRSFKPDLLGFNAMQETHRL